MKPPLRSRHVTIRDVAQLAGVSPATVSKVVNSTPYVSSEAKARVMNAIEKLNYKPNSIARSLKTRHTRTLGLITDDLEAGFSIALMRGVEAAASAQGFSVFLCNSYEEASRERDHLEVLLNKQVDGIILLSGYRIRERGAPALPVGKLPVVYLFQYTHDIAVPCVIPDNVAGGALGTRHLLESGRKRIALISGPPRHYDATHLRFIGYQQVLKDAAIPFDPALVRTGDWHEASGYRLAHELMRLPEPPDAIFCLSDYQAIGALDALRELGLRVPHDVALVGFNNVHSAAYQRPPLTSVALPLMEMGKLAGELLIAAIFDRPPEAKIYELPCYLVKRESSEGGVV